MCAGPEDADNENHVTLVVTHRGTVHPAQNTPELSPCALWKLQRHHFRRWQLAVRIMGSPVVHRRLTVMQQHAESTAQELSQECANDNEVAEAQLDVLEMLWSAVQHHETCLRNRLDAESQQAETAGNAARRMRRTIMRRLLPDTEGEGLDIAHCGAAHSAASSSLRGVSGSTLQALLEGLESDEVKLNSELDYAQKAVQRHKAQHAEAIQQAQEAAHKADCFPFERPFWNGQQATPAELERLQVELRALGVEFEAGVLPAKSYHAKVRALRQLQQALVTTEEAYCREARDSRQRVFREITRVITLREAARSCLRHRAREADTLRGTVLAWLSALSARGHGGAEEELLVTHEVAWAVRVECKQRKHRTGSEMVLALEERSQMESAGGCGTRRFTPDYVFATG